MFRFFLGCLAVAAIGLMISQAVAGGNNHGNMPSNNGIVVIETISSSSVVEPQNVDDMEPLPNNPGVEVAPIQNSTSSQVSPVVVEEGMMIEQTEGE